MKKAYSEALVHLMKNEPFYANLLLNINVVYTNKMPTLGVTYSNKRFCLLINEDFFSKFDVRGRAAILKHELLHIVSNHIAETKKKSRFTKFKGKLNHSFVNVCADIAINQFICDLPEGAEIDGKPIKFATLKNAQEKIPHLLGYESTEYYIKELMEEAKKNGNLKPEEQAGGQTIDEHGEWENIDANSEELAEASKQVTKDAVRATKAGAGRVPGEIEIALDKLSGKLSWNKILQNFVAQAVHTDKEANRKKRHRRYGITQPGAKFKDTISIVVGVDTSGSVSQDELSAFAGEIEKIHGKGFDITVVECDSEIRNVLPYKRGCLANFKGGGGTMYQPVITKAKELNTDLLIFFGDGDCADVPNKPSFPVLWVITRGNSNPSNFGKLINLEL